MTETRAILADAQKNGKSQACTLEFYDPLFSCRHPAYLERGAVIRRNVCEALQQAPFHRIC